MPSDSSIYGLIRQPPPQAGPMDMLGQQLQIKHLMDTGQLNSLQRQQLEESLASNTRIRDLFASGQSPTEQQVFAADPKMGLTYQKTLLENQKTKGEIERTRVETTAAAAKQFRDLVAQASTDADMPMLHDAAKQLFGPDIGTKMSANMPQRFDPEWQKKTVMTGDQLLERLMPKLAMTNTGGATTPTNPYTGAPAGAPIPHTPTFGERTSLAHLGVTAATADPFGTLGIQDIARRAGAFGPGGAQGATPPFAGAPSAAGSAAASGALSGDEYLKTLPKPMADQVKALAEGRMAFPGGFALKSPYWQQMITSVSQYDPGFDAVNFNARSSTRKAFTSGSESKSLNALNTVMGHLDEMDKAASGLNNTGFTLWNQAVNAVGGTVSPELKSRLNRFNLTKQAVVDEMERAYRGAGGSQAGIDAWKKTLSDADSYEALRASIQQGVKLLDSKIQSLGDQYSKGMGTTTNGLTLLAPHAQDTFNRLVRDADSQTATGAIQPSQSDIDAELRRRGVIK